MRSRLLPGCSALAAVLLLITACVARTPPPELPASGVLPTTVRVQVRDGPSLIVLAVPIEDYVAATIISEVDPAAADEQMLERMYEVQATISRTYAVSHRGRHAREGFDLCATTHCQLYEPARLRTSKWARAAREAATATAGQVVWFRDAPARTVYHADCGGHTSAAVDVWGGDARPYLTALRDTGSGVTHLEWRFESARAALRDALNRDARTAVGPRLDAIQIAHTDSAGRAEQIALRGTRVLTVRGEVFREVVGRAVGAKGLRSTLFTIDRAGDTFVFTGRGFGHGVGLCQAGAFARVQSGASPLKVLSYYFPGTTVVRLH